MQSLLHYIETGVKEGAKLVYGGKRLDRKGKELEKYSIYLLAVFKLICCFVLKTSQILVGKVMIPSAF